MGTVQQIRGVTPDTASLIAEAIEQGWAVEETKNGRLWWRPPSAAVTAVFSGKKLRGREVLNIRARLRERGLKPAMASPAARAVKEMHQPQVGGRLVAPVTASERARRDAVSRAANREGRRVSFEPEVLAAAIRAKGNQAAVAQAIGVDPTTLSGWKVGKAPIATERAITAYRKLEEIALAEMTKSSPHPDHVALRVDNLVEAAIAVEPATALEPEPEPAGAAQPPADAGEATATLREDIEAVTELIEELVRRRVKGAQERIGRLERELEEERGRCADLRDENERLRRDRAKIAERAQEMARQAAEEALKKFLQ